MADSLVFSALTRLTAISTSDRARLFQDEEVISSLAAGRLPRGSDPKISKALAKLDLEKYRMEDEAALASGVVILAWPDARYPALLREIPDPPPALYLRGSSDALALPGVAVVGSRLSTVYGQNVARMLCADLARQGCSVVSGLARGIDTAAHEGSLAIQGHAIAVLGTGIDVFYPKENEGLYGRIIEQGGAIVTENPPNVPPLPRNFPVRNRIIAGIAWGTVVVEADGRSGSLVTARFTLETGRELFAVPHNITSRMGVGPNTLIQKGAKLVQRAGDILEEMPPHLRNTLIPLSETEDIRCPPEGDAGRLLAKLHADEPRSVDALCEATGWPASKVLAILIELKIAGACIELPGMRYALASASAQ